MPHLHVLHPPPPLSLTCPPAPLLPSMLRQVMNAVTGIVSRHLGSVRLKGKALAVDVCTVEATLFEATPALTEACATFDHAVMRYTARDFVRARALFLEYCKSEPSDEYAMQMVAACDRLIAKPPPLKWTAVHDPTQGGP